MVQASWHLIKQTFREWSEDKVARLSAALAYYTMFAIAPLVIIAIAIAGFVFSEEAARGEIQQQLTGMIGEAGAATVQQLVENASRPGAGIIATVLGVVFLLVGATGVFAELQDSLNTIWEVKPKQTGVWGMVRARLLSFVIVLGIVLLLMAALIASAVMSGLAAASEGLPGGLANSIPILQVANIVVSLLLFTVLFAMVFKLLPDANIRWRDVWIGSLATAVLFTIGKELIGLYLARGTATSVFGAAGSLVAILIWVYYSAHILFLGAEFTQVYARWSGSRIEPAENAVSIREEDQAMQEKAAGKRSSTESRPPSAAVEAPAVAPGAAPKSEPWYPARAGRGVPAVRGRRPPVYSSQKEPATMSKIIPLLLGAAVGALLSSRKKTEPPRISPMPRERHFSVGAMLEPGWVSRRKHHKPAPTLGRSLAERLRYGYQHARDNA